MSEDAQGCWCGVGFLYLQVYADMMDEGPHDLQSGSLEVNVLSRSAEMAVIRQQTIIANQTKL